MAAARALRASPANFKAQRKPTAYEIRVYEV